MPRLHPPDKQAILALPPYPGIAPAAVRQPQTGAELDAALDDLLAQAHIGFDTESRPTFTRGTESSGPEVVQFATPGRAYVLQLRHAGCEALVRQVLADARVVKVGFDLQQDLGQLRRRLGVEVTPLLDLTRVFHRMGYPRTLGIKSAVAVLFGQRLAKSKRVTTSNWANPVLTPQQVQYAANDAWVALQVLRALQARDAALLAPAPATGDQ